MPILEAGLDALSFTMLRDTPQEDFTRNLLFAHLDAERAAGNDLREVHPQGFDCLQCGHVMLGTRDKWLRGEVKSGLSDEIAKEMRTNGIQAKVTRTDWQVTVEHAETISRRAESTRSRARGAIEKDRKPRPSKSVLYESGNGADTCYLRTAGDSCTFRLYNKSAESPDTYPLNTWRYELQLRARRARETWNMFQSAANSTWLARSLVSGFMLKYDLEEAWQLSDEPCATPSRYEKSDTARRLQYWQDTCIPVALKLIDAGYPLADLIERLRSEAKSAPRKRRQLSLNVGDAATEAPLKGVGFYARL